MPSLSDLRPGDIAFGPIGGGVGFGVGLGQILTAPWKDRLSWKRWWKIRHTGIVGSWPNPELGDGPILVQAEPGGLEAVEMTPERYWTNDWIYIRPQYSPGQADLVAQIAQRQALKKIPYAFECYPAIALHRSGVPTPGLSHWLARTDADGDPVRVICSWEVDSALTLAGFGVFDDGRVPHDVIPAELYLRLLEIGPAEVLSAAAGLGYSPGATVRAIPHGRRPIPEFLL